MAQRRPETIGEELLSLAGITVNGKETYDIQVHNKDFYQRILRDGALGLGNPIWMGGGLPGA